MKRRVLSALFLLVAVWVPAAAQAQDPWVGDWTLNLSKSKYDPANLAPKVKPSNRRAWRVAA